MKIVSSIKKILNNTQGSIENILANIKKDIAMRKHIIENDSIFEQFMSDYPLTTEDVVGLCIYLATIASVIVYFTCIKKYDQT